MKKTIAWIAAAIALSGCQSLQYLGGIEGLPNTSVKGDQELTIELLRPADSSRLEPGADPELRKALEECKNAYVAAAGPIASILISAAGQFLFDAWVERERAQLELYKKLATPPAYSQTSFVSSIFDQTRCIVLIRETVARDAAGHETGRSAGLVMVLYGERYVGKDGARAFTFTPRYVKANNAVAFVAKETPTLSTAVSMSLKGIVKQTNGLPNVVQVGETVLSVEGIEVGPQSAAACRTRRCAASGFLAIPPSEAGATALTISIAERGSLPTDNLATADLELKALKDALGPGIHDALKEYFK